MKRVVTIVQARVNSTRLPGKVMLPLCGKPLLWRMLQRVMQAKMVGTVVVATTYRVEDDPIVELCRQEGVEVFRGHPEDLLDRHHEISKKYQADVVVKIPSDCPLIHSQVIDRVIGFYLEHEMLYDFVSNLHPATYPDGNDVEVMSARALEYSWMHATRLLEREHTTPFMWENVSLFKIGNVSMEGSYNFSMSHRWTIDYEEDYEFIKNVFERLFPSNPGFSTQDILDLEEQQPELQSINRHLVGVNWYRHHLDELKTIDKNQTRQFEEVRNEYQRDKQA